VRFDSSSNGKFLAMRWAESGHSVRARFGGAERSHDCAHIEQSEDLLFNLNKPGEQYETYLLIDLSYCPP
jgi:hypothetical protein